MRSIRRQRLTIGCHRWWAIDIVLPVQRFADGDSFDIDDVPWKDDLVTEPPRIENGHLIMPTKPGWGADINEDMVKRHPPK
jgi:L-alanine-DL-glutamate epimerase-like enolase superfamily enzyme